MLELYRHPKVVFVFGSNLAGVHGAGAAAHAHKHWGAQWGVGEGLTGRAYALPTKDATVRHTLSLATIQGHVHTFVEFARENPDLIFLVTPFGCGLAGLREDVILNMITKAGGPTRNMLFTASWFNPEVFDA